MIQISHLYMATGKAIVLTRWTFVGKVMSLLFNMLSRLAITLLPRSKCLLISWLQSPSAVILGSKNIKSDTVSTVSLSVSHEVMGPDTMILVLWMLSFKPTLSLYSFTLIKRLFISSSRDFQESSPAPQFWKYQFFSAQLSLWSKSHICTWLLGKPELWIYGPLSAKW